MDRENNNQIRSAVALLAASLRFYKQNFAAIVLILILPLMLSIAWAMIQNVGSWRTTGELVLATFVSLILLALINVFAQIAFINLIVAEGSWTVRAYLRQARIFFLPFLWVAFLAGLVSIGATVFLVVPGILIGVWLIFSSFIVVAEGKRGFDALLASWHYVSGHWWRVLGYLLIFALVLIVAAVILNLGIAPAARRLVLDFGFSEEVLGLVSTGVAGLINGLIFSPIGAIYLFFLYQELRGLKGEPDLASLAAKSRFRWLVGFFVVGLALTALFVSLVIGAVPLISALASLGHLSSLAGLGMLPDLSGMLWQ